MNSILFKNSVRFILLILIQVLILSHINFLGYVNPYVYILFIILYPVKNNRELFIFISFLLGLIIDIFLDSGGVHAAASVTLAFIRPAFLKSIFGALYEHQTVKFSQADFNQQFSFITIATLVHHFILFSLEIFNFSYIILIAKKTFFSSIFTIILCIIITVIFSRKS